MRRSISSWILSALVLFVPQRAVNATDYVGPMLNESSIEVVFDPTDPQDTVNLPDYEAELLSADWTRVSWSKNLVLGGRTNHSLFLKDDPLYPDDWLGLDFNARPYGYRAFDFFVNRGIYTTTSGGQEYTESLHLAHSPEPSLEIPQELQTNGLAPDAVDGSKVLYSGELPYRMMTNLAPRWFSLIDYEWLTSSRIADVLEQDNLTAAFNEGKGDIHRYSDYDSKKFCHFASSPKPDFCLNSGTIRDYLALSSNSTLLDLVTRTDPAPTLAEMRTVVDDPVMREYLLFQHISHLHEMTRHRDHAKLEAARAGRELAIVGNLGGAPRPIYVGGAHRVMVSEMVDIIMWESWTRSHTMFEGAVEPVESDVGGNRSHARGPLGIAIAFAQSHGEAALFFFDDLTPGTTPENRIRHDWSELLAGGGVVHTYTNLAGTGTARGNAWPDYRDLVSEHRALFGSGDKTRYAKVGVLYSLPTLIYSGYRSVPLVKFRAEGHVAALEGVARSLEEAHVSYDIVPLNHPRIRPDLLEQPDLDKYDVLIIPEVTELSDAHHALLKDFPGEIVTLGEYATFDEQHNPASFDRLVDLQQSASVTEFSEIIPGKQSFAHAHQKHEGNRKSRIEAFGAAIRGMISPIFRAAADGSDILDKRLWVKAWIHDGFFSAHFVNYNIDGMTYNATTPPALGAPGEKALQIELPAGIVAEDVYWIAPGSPEPQAVPHTTAGGQLLNVELPLVDNLYGILVVGSEGAEIVASQIKRGDHDLERVRLAGTRGGMDDEDLETRISEVEGNLPSDPGAYAAEARALLDTIQDELDVALYMRLFSYRVQPAEVDPSVLYFDFGSSNTEAPWDDVRIDTLYPQDPTPGSYGWLPAETDPSHVPFDDLNYRDENGSDDGALRLQINASNYWPNPKILSGVLLPTPMDNNHPAEDGLESARPHTFRVDVDPGCYRVDVLSRNLSLVRRRFSNAGMVFADGVPYLFDTPLEYQGDVNRSFVHCRQPESDFIDLRFGGATGFGVSAVTLTHLGEEAEFEDELLEQPIRQWSLSERHPNPEWFPIYETDLPMDDHLADPENGDTEWTVLSALDGGLPLIDLGVNDPSVAETGDIVYAVGTFEAPTPGTAELSVGSTSSALVWLNGEPVGTGKYSNFLPDSKGLLRDKLRVPISYKKGTNVVVLKLRRFLERRWMFYASIVDDQPCGDACDLYLDGLASGGGSVSITINGEVISVLPSASDTPQDIGVSLANEIEAVLGESGIWASYEQEALRTNGTISDPTSTDSGITVSTFVVLSAENLPPVAEEDGAVKTYQGVPHSTKNLSGTARLAVEGLFVHRPIFSFDTSSVPDNSRARGGQLELFVKESENDFMSLGDMVVDFSAAGFGSDLDLATEDFYATAEIDSIASKSVEPVGGSWFEEFELGGFTPNSISGRAQFRIRFTATSGNGRLELATGNFAHLDKHPKLTLELVEVACPLSGDSDGDGICNAAETPFDTADLVAGSGDGLLTYDYEAGLIWLDLTQTEELSINQVLAGEWTTAGFRHATTAEVCSLLTRYFEQSFPCPNGLGYESPSVLAGFVAQFGDTYQQTTQGYFDSGEDWGYAGVYKPATFYGAFESDEDPDGSSDASGHFLVMEMTP